MKNTIVFSVALSTFLFLVKNEVAAQSQQVDQSFLGVEKIDLNVAIGSVEVSPSSSSEVFVKGYFDEDKLKVKVWKDGNTLSIVEKTKHQNNNGIRSRWVLVVPKGTEIEADLGMGDFDLTDYTGEVEGNSGTGNFNLNNSKVELEWNCGTGDFAIAESEGEFGLNTGTGDIRLAGLRGEISASTGTGNVNLKNCTGHFNANSGTGDVSAAGLTVSGASSFNSGTGDVDVKLGEHTEADLTVNSGTGNAKLDMNGQDFNGTLTMYCNKTSGDIKAPFEFDKEWEEDNGRKKITHKSKRFGDADLEVKVGTGTGRAVVK